jgi:hypothetical protein
MAKSIRIYGDLGNEASAFEDGLPLQLFQQQLKDAEDAAAKRRAARSLLGIQKGDLAGCTFTLNPESEFEKAGGGW